RTSTITATVDAVASGPDHRHQLDVQKSEVHLDLEPGQTRTVTTTCQPGYVVLDGSGRVDAVDQGTGTLASVRTTESRAIGADTWQVTMTNEASGRAQGKLFSVCVRAETETINGNAHHVVVPDTVVSTQPLVAGRTDVTLTCGPDQTPIRPGYLLDGVASVVTSYPSGASGWTFSVDNGAASSGTFSLGCLSRTTSASGGHRHPLDLFEVTENVTVAPGQGAEITLSCADAKGIVAGYDLPPGLVNLGNDPRPVVRVVKLVNPTSSPLHASLRLLCLGVRTADPAGGAGVVRNTAAATTASLESSYDDNADDATFTVDTSSVASPVASGTIKATSVVTKVRCTDDDGACRGRARLVATKRLRAHGTVVRRGALLARASYRVAAGTHEKLSLKPTKAGRVALGSKRLTKARITVDGTTRVIRLRR
ncbi:MAG: hypothetical protein KKA97_04670, partial [Actinobacteria bacterium]|nr:hypothetical protein [Actinomycetota bacterium]